MTEIKSNLDISIFPTREKLGQQAAKDIGEKIADLLKIKAEIRMIFAAAPSQNEMLHYLANSDEIDWSRINAFHMDEYIGLPEHTPQLFSNFLKEHLFDLVSFRETHFINGNNPPEMECRRYGGLIKHEEIDIVCMGIGENGHIAFNDPPVADFSDPEIMKQVQLDQMCRQQQVNDKCFDRIEDVPEYALTLTIPALMSASYIFCVVPGKAKQKAVFDTIHGEISTSCPASILRTHKNSKLYLDNDSAALLELKR